MLKIVQAPQEVLSVVSKKVEGLPPSVDKRLLLDMQEALENASDPKGVGLAAPQIGKSVAVFIAKPTEKSKIQVFINPQIISVKNSGPKTKKIKKDKKLEGCLSLKDIWGEVKRYNEVTLDYFDEKGNQHKKKFKGFMATIVQHEVDHLNGVLFPKRVLEQKGKLYKSTKDEKGEMVFEPVEI